MKFKTLIPIFLLILLSSIVLAAYSITRNSPGDYSVENSTTVTFSLNVSGGSNVSMNCSNYYNTNASTKLLGPFTEYGLGSFANNTDSTGTQVFSDLARVWYKIGCYDTVGGTVVVAETGTIPASLANVPLTYDTDGVQLTTVAGWVNWTKPELNETLGYVTPPNNSVVNVSFNATVSSIIQALATINATHNATMVAGTDYSLVGMEIYMNSSTYTTNTSYWSYEHYVATALDDNWNTSNNLIYMNSSTFAGDTSYWNYSWPGDNHVNEVNTTVRVMDIDNLYWDYLNISLPISVPSIVIEPTLALPTCVAGTIAYNTTDEHFYGCINATDWVQLDN